MPGRRRSSPSRGLVRVEPEADRVDAVAQVRGRGEALAAEDVAHVGVACRAADLDPLHPHRRVLDVADPVLRQWGVERRPAAGGIELRLRAEQLGDEVRYRLRLA